MDSISHIKANIPEQRLKQSGAAETTKPQISYKADSVQISSSTAKVAGKESDIKQQPDKSVSPPVSSTKTPAKKKWTVLMYFAGDNNLEKHITQNAIDAEWRGSNSNINLLLQLDRGQNPSPLSGGWGGARRYYLKKGWDPENITSPAIKDLGQIDMSSPDTLSDFLSWGIKNYPAENYILIISSHGCGWEGAIDDRTHLENPEAEGWMNLHNLKAGLSKAQKETGVKLDVLGFDACLMAQAEVVHELQEQAKYLIASEEVIGNAGLPYDRILFTSTFKTIDDALKSKTDITPEELSKKIIKFAEISQSNLPTLSALDLSKGKYLMEATKEFALSIRKTQTPIKNLLDIMDATQKFDQYGYKDFYDFASRVASSDKIEDRKLKESAKNLLKALDKLIIANEHSPQFSNANGVSVNLIFNFDEESMHYREKTEFAKDTGWDEALKKMQY